MFISVVDNLLFVTMAVTKILLYVVIAANQACMVTMPCAGTAARVLLIQSLIRCCHNVVIVTLIAVMVLMNLTHILSVIIAQRRAIYPAQVFLGTVENFVMAMPRVQTSGMNYSQPVDLIKTGPNPMDLVLPSAVRIMTSTSVKTDPCV